LSPAGQLDALTDAGVVIVEVAAEDGGDHQGPGGAPHQDVVAARLGLAGDAGDLLEHRLQIAPEPAHPGQLVLGEQAPALVAGLLEQPPRGAAHLRRLLQAAAPPGQEAGQPQLDHRAGGGVRQPLQDGVHAPQRRDADLGVGVGAVVDHPAGVP
jgi:hypothetical protein